MGIFDFFNRGPQQAPGTLFVGGPNNGQIVPPVPVGQLGGATGNPASAFMRYLPALEFANALGTQMASAGGNQAGAGIGQFNAQQFQNIQNGRANDVGMQVGQSAPPAQASQMQQPQAVAGGAAMPQTQRYFNAAPATLGQTQVGAPNPTIPPAATSGSPAGGQNPIAKYWGFDPRVYQNAVALGQDQSRLGIQQAQESRTAQTFNPELIRANDQLAYNQSLYNYFDKMQPQRQVFNTGDALVEATIPQMQMGPNGPVAGGATMFNRGYEVPQMPKVEQVGNTLGIVDPRTGQFTPTYTAPVRTESPSWTINPETGQAVNPKTLEVRDIPNYKPKAGAGFKDDATLTRNVRRDVIANNPAYIEAAKKNALKLGGTMKDANGNDVPKINIDFLYKDPVSGQPTNPEVVMQYLPKAMLPKFNADVDKMISSIKTTGSYSQSTGSGFQSELANTEIEPADADVQALMRMTPGMTRDEAIAELKAGF